MDPNPRPSRVEIRFETRRNPSTVYIWAYWRLPGADQWASVGDPDHGRGSHDRMRKRAFQQAAEARLRERPPPASP